jgi:23S rRNA (guanosine2251-2'-O)-methyltransferase
MKSQSVKKETAREPVLVIPNIRSAHNVGSLFRTADGAGFSKVYLCGYTPTLTDKFGRLGRAQKEIAKTALGAERIVPSEYVATLKETIKKLKKEGFVVIGLEQDEKAIKIGEEAGGFFLKKLIKNSPRIALVVGEEVSGMTAADRRLMDHLVELPMFGKKESLNVSVAGGIGLYLIRWFNDWK